jgi:predicted RNase H-like nuclease
VLIDARSRPQTISFVANRASKSTRRSDQSRRPSGVLLRDLARQLRVGHARQVRFIGVDLAWGNVNETGVVACDEAGVVLSAGWTTGVEETAHWIQSAACQDTIAFVDAPLVVLNEGGQRACETQVGQRYGRWKVSANSTNLKTVRTAGIQLRNELDLQGWRYDDGVDGPSRGGRSFSECYPYATLVGATELGYEDERPRYKRGPRGMPAAQWRPLRAEMCDELIARLARLREASPPLHLRSHPVTAELVNDRSPLANRAYKHREDLIDACVAAWTAALWWTHGFKRAQVLGANDPLQDSQGVRATIIAPARAAQRREAHSVPPTDAPQSRFVWKPGDLKMIRRAQPTC